MNASKFAKKASRFSDPGWMESCPGGKLFGVKTLTVLQVSQLAAHLVTTHLTTGYIYIASGLSLDLHCR